MVVTLAVSHESIGWLKADADEKIKDIDVTLEVSHESMGWLKADA